MTVPTRTLSILVTAVLAMCWIGLGEEFMGVEDIRAGMKGVGKTVFSGTKVEEFDVEILGVLKRAIVKGDIILAKLSGGPLKETGVISGMSGSPIYIRGKLIGAVAYRWGAFAKESICGITPISEMMTVFAEGASSMGESSQELSHITVPHREGLEPFWGGTLVPIGSPLHISGFDERTIRHIQPFFERFNLIPVLGGEHPGEGLEENPPFEPGSCLGIQIMTGDANLTAMGTLTYTDGDRILGFGHPMFYTGSTQLPVTGGWVHSLLPSQWASFKITSPTQVLGTIEEDRRAGIAGTLGRGPELLPLNLIIDGEPYSFRLVKERSLIPSLVGWATFNSILSSARLLGDLTASTVLEIQLEGHAPLRVQGLLSGAKTPLEAAQHLDKVLRQILDNKFEEVRLERIALSIQLVYDRLTAEIERVTLGGQRLSPGDTLEVLIFLRSYRGESVSEVVRIPIPKEAPEGDYTLKVVDGPTYWNDEKKRVPMRFEPESFPGLLSLIQDSPKGDEILCQLYSSSPGATIRGEELPSLPPSIISTMKSSKQSGGESLTRSSMVAERKVETGFLVSGNKEIKFPVNRR